LCVTAAPVPDCGHQPPRAPQLSSGLEPLRRSAISEQDPVSSIKIGNQTENNLIRCISTQALPGRSARFLDQPCLARGIHAATLRSLGGRSGQRSPTARRRPGLRSLARRAWDAWCGQVPRRARRQGGLSQMAARSPSRQRRAFRTGDRAGPWGGCGASWSAPSREAAGAVRSEGDVRDERPCAGGPTRGSGRGRRG
jgi:hypothetical protein